MRRQTAARLRPQPLKGCDPPVVYLIGIVEVLKKEALGRAEDTEDR